jgi:hypothetical protein
MFLSSPLACTENPALFAQMDPAGTKGWGVKREAPTQDSGGGVAPWLHRGSFIRSSLWAMHDGPVCEAAAHA